MLVKDPKVFLHSIETVLPPYSYSQDFARDRMVGWTDNARTKRIIRYLYNHSGIDRRYSVIPSFQADHEGGLFSTNQEGSLNEPTTGERNDQFVASARELVVTTGRQVMNQDHGFQPSDITHVITMSCTGFYNPGPDLDLVEALNLSPDVERYQLGFMGCYAAFPALKMARQFCLVDPEAVVLVVSIELCSLHIQISDVPDQVLGNALFADGCAGALVSARNPDHGSGFTLNGFSSALIPSEERHMAWEIGDLGFRLSLSGYVPNVLSAHIDSLVATILDKQGLTFSDIEHWAIHPGGKAILDKIESSLKLDKPSLSSSREVLKNYGNMSSATILFVLQKILQEPVPEKPEPVFAMAFGPGLTVESALLSLEPNQTRSLD